ncbi:GNAT family N-acetyltransferase [Arthrobacter sp. ISL-48]|uniref:GNAT family N-acetyltransferase n=1 Tax=Arthrobacter sp. ISL-48 TaxID=2819110 RepID=UPI001BEAEFFC|nr:GNAT family N-acetyltransferase [Arthrobacter sp. ISL-48]MBT2531247.1 GNAT family N-acetyltransferase [Arthrobacter sp. ISL-48]
MFRVSAEVPRIFEPRDKIVSSRLTLTGWTDSDYQHARDWHGDPAVMSPLGGPIGEEASDSLVDRWRRELENGYGMLAVRESADTQAIGAVGLGLSSWGPDAASRLDIGWRLAQGSWGRGFATEAAHKILNVAFSHSEIQQIFAYTTVTNFRSAAVMSRIGMVKVSDGDFLRALPFSKNPKPALHGLWVASSNNHKTLELKGS